MNKNKVLFGPGGCLTQQAIELYLDGRLSDPEKRKILNHTSKCALCKDSLEGVKHFASAKNYASRLTSIRNSAWRKSLEPARASRRLFYGISTVAASVLIIIGVYYILQMRNVFEEGTVELAQEISIPASDSLSRLDILPMENPLTEHEVQKNAEVKRKSEVESNRASTAEPKVLKPAIRIEPVAAENIAETSETLLRKKEDLYFDTLDTDLLDLNTRSKINSTPLEVSSPQELKLSKAMGNEPADKRILTSGREYEDSSTGFSYNEKKARQASYMVAEVMPMFNGGGVDSFSNYIADSLKLILPQSMWNQSIIIGFKITKSGKVDNVKLISGTGSKEYNKAIVHLVSNSPLWMPGYLSGNAIDVDQQIKITLFDQ